MLKNIPFYFTLRGLLKQIQALTSTVEDLEEENGKIENLEKQIQALQEENAGQNDKIKALEAEVEDLQ